MPSINEGLFTSGTQEWTTPKDLFRELDAEFHFDLDPCSTHENAVCEDHYTIEDDGLKQNWGGRRVFCNPPYGRKISKWVRKCHDESLKPGTLVVMLVPARTDTAWFHNYIYNRSEIRFLKGRLRFNDGDRDAPFPSMVVVFRSCE